MRRRERGTRVRRLAVGLAAACLVLGVEASGAGGSAAVASGPATFAVSGSVRSVPADGFPASACGRALETLAPGVTRCLAVRFDNRLDRPLSVRTLVTSLDPSFPPPPEGCTGADLVLPVLGDPVAVPARGSASGPALPIMMRDSGSNQDACKDTVLHLAFTASAISIDRTGGPGSTAPSALAFTGANAAVAAFAGLLLSALGGLVLLAARRRGRCEETT